MGYSPFSDLVADAYDFNDHAYRRFVERLKVFSVWLCLRFN
jgi:hypothetical protein